MENLFYVTFENVIHTIEKVEKNVYKAVNYYNKLFTLTDDDLKFYCFKSYRAAYICALGLFLKRMLNFKPNDESMKDLVDRLKVLYEDLKNFEVDDNEFNYIKENQDE